jgi:hypothetical protein
MPVAIEAKLIAGLVAVIAVLILIGLIAHQKSEITALNTQIVVFKADIQKDIDVNAADQAVITSQSKALALWQDAVSKAASAEVGARADLAAANAAHAVTKTHLKTMEKSDVAIPACEDVLRVDLAQFCNGTVAALRVRNAASSLQGPSGANPGPDVGPPR